jgi:hypothetical protein
VSKDRSSSHLDPDVLERAIGDLRYTRMLEPDAADFARRLEKVRARLRQAKADE